MADTSYFPCDALARRKHGMGIDELRSLNDGLLICVKGSKGYHYHIQKKAAQKRGISWEITFAEWVRIWNESGKWNLRGCRKGQYVMARTGDVGPYKVGNVRIASVEENHRDRTLSVRARKASHAVVEVV